MLPRIEPEATVDIHYRSYVNKLRETTYGGEIRTDYASRLAVATDNSIYQVIPQLVLLPQSLNDIRIILSLGHEDQFRHHIKFAPRGGGTGTNGQSLSAGIIIDCSKHMREIIELDLEEKWIHVQPGIVLDELNAFLRPYGFYFAPQVSTSNRATLGGMINTDACGNGSLLLGRTSDHLLELTCVLSDGTVVQTNSPPSFLTDALRPILENNADFIKEKFHNVPRTLTGYNLAKASRNGVDITQLFAGSEGTLGVVAECKLKITPLPRFKKVILVKYKSFDDALRAPELRTIKPLVIETIDNKLLSLARKDKIYHHLKTILDSDNIFPEAINIIELVNDTEEDLELQIQFFLKHLSDNSGRPHYACGFYIAQNTQEEKLLWDLRKKSVGLISQEHIGKRRPIPFIEDTAVPPELLADYISEFKKLLDSYQLTYGMYGHIDAGCIHIRPALDLQNPEDEKLIKELSDKVVTLVEKYHGVMWGEHGKGYRSEYTERFFGEKLHLALREIKTIFDPYNQLNPGKIVTPLNNEDAAVVKLDAAFRARLDKEINEATQEEFNKAMICNGNGACFSQSNQETMCPSYKATGDRIHSPKGRSVVFREWLRQLAGYSFQTEALSTHFFKKIWNSFFAPYDFSHEVFNAMHGCLGCKACTSQCPLKVDVPDFKSKFLFFYYQRYLRPVRDIALSKLEKFNMFFGRFPNFSNLLFHNKLMKNLIANTTRLIDIPAFSPVTLKTYLKRQNAPAFNKEHLQNLTSAEKAKSIILLQDAFTSYYESLVVTRIYGFFSKAGIRVYVAPFFENGKPLHVKGFTHKFKTLVMRNAAYLKQLSELGIDIVGIDPSITLTYRDEYKKISNHSCDLRIFLLQEWLVNNLDKLKIAKPEHLKTFYLLSHCTEKSNCVLAEEQWQKIFLAFGTELKILSAGCCGMAGSYGHEIEHVATSVNLFKVNWQEYLKNYDNIVATGYSCRSQVLRLVNKKLLHPLEALLEVIN